MHPDIPGVTFAQPMQVSAPEEGAWYHYFDWPDGRTTRGRLDFRQNVEPYLGRLDYKGKSVLEVGPASGFLTKELAARGASVTCIDLPDDHPWDAVPRMDMDVDGWVSERKRGTKRHRASWWYAQKQFGTDARMLYWNIDRFPEWFGKVRFDVVFLGSILQHFRHPIDVIYNVARLTDTLVVSELQVDWVEKMGLGAHFVPAKNNDILGSWWNLSSSLVKQVAETCLMERVSHEVHPYRIWALKGKTDSSDQYVDRNIWVSVFKRP